MPDASVTGGMLRNLVQSSGRRYAISAPHISPGDVVIRGSLNNYRCHSGLRVHATDTLEAHDLQTSTEVEPELTIAVFLEGTVETELDGHRMQLGDAHMVSGHMWMIGRRCRCRRISKKGTRIRKVLISAPPAWIEQFHPDPQVGADAISTFMSTHGATADWAPSKRVIALCEQILSPANAPHVIRCMGVESKAIEIFSEALASLAGGPGVTCDGASVKSLSRAQAIRTYLVDHIDEELSLGAVAKELALSVESMQRAFKAAYGRTIVDFVREYRLHQARRAICSEGISVSEAAYRAGYSSPANFSTAFKKLFGLTPSEARE